VANDESATQLRTVDGRAHQSLITEVGGAVFIQANTRWADAGVDVGRLLKRAHRITRALTVDDAALANRAERDARVCLVTKCARATSAEAAGVTNRWAHHAYGGVVAHESGGAFEVACFAERWGAHAGPRVEGAAPLLIMLPA
jgi:hypothetical protein